MQENSVYQEIVDNGLAATGAALVVLARTQPGSNEVRLEAWSGLESGPLQSVLAAARRFLPDFNPIRIVARTDANAPSRGVYAEGRSVSATLQEAGAGIVDDRVLRLGTTLAGIQHSFICPLKVGGRVAGSLSFLSSSPLSEAQRHTGEAFARQASLILENAHLVEALQRQLAEVQQSRQQITAAEERMRREIAELLHGRVQTRLLVAWHRLGECERLLASDPSKAGSLITEVRREIDEIREQEVRQASHMLHPSIIGVGLVPAVRSLIARFEGYFCVSLQVDPRLAQLDEPLRNRIPEPLRLAAYRVVEEGLTNIYRHAKAERVALFLRLDDEHQLTVVVRDYGCGFDPASLKPGLGLSSIAGRVDQLGGKWQISSAPGEGTRLSVHLPAQWAAIENPGGDDVHSVSLPWGDLPGLAATVTDAGTEGAITR